MSEVLVSPKTMTVVVDGVSARVDQLPPGLDRIITIHWNGQYGEIHRTSVVPGRVDFEHFADPGLIQPYIDAHVARIRANAEVAAREAARREDDAAEEERQAALAEQNRVAEAELAEKVRLHNEQAGLA